MALPWTQYALETPPRTYMYRIPFFCFPSRVVLASAAAVEDLFQHSLHMQRCPDFDLSWIMQAMLGQSLVVANGVSWRRQLGQYKGWFSPKAAVSLDKVMVSQDLSVRWIHGMFQRCQADPEYRNTVTLTVMDFLQLPFDIVAVALFGPRSCTQAVLTELKSFWSESSDITSAIFRVSSLCSGLADTLRHCLARSPTLSSRIVAFRNRWTDFVRRMIRAARDDPSLFLHDFSYLLPEVRGEHSDVQLRNLGKVTWEELLDFLTEIILANADFVAAAVAWPLYHLHAPENLDCLQKVKTELSAFLSPRDGTGCRLVKPEAVQSGLRYLGMVLKESWRLEPMFLVTNPVVLDRAVQIQDYSVPAGTRIVIDTKAVNRGATWTNPHSFLPERFEKDPDPASSTPALHIFGLGSRRCLGKYYAIPVVKQILSLILANFSVTTAEEQRCFTTDVLTGPFEFPRAKFQLTPLSRNHQP